MAPMAIGIMVKVMTSGPTGMLDRPVIFITKMIAMKRDSSAIVRALNFFSI
jgi:hypothetical protein